MYKFSGNSRNALKVPGSPMLPYRSKELKLAIVCTYVHV